jgi:hypothetical protein
MSVIEYSYWIFNCKNDIIDNVRTVHTNLNEFLHSYEAKIAQNANNSFKRIYFLFKFHGCKCILGEKRLEKKKILNRYYYGLWLDMIRCNFVYIISNLNIGLLLKLYHETRKRIRKKSEKLKKLKEANQNRRKNKNFN